MEHKIAEEYELAKSKAQTYLESCRKWRDYYNGIQWKYISDVDEHAAQPEINYIKPNVLQLLAMLQLKHPSILVNPTRASGAATADILTTALKSIYENKGLARDVLLATSDMLKYSRGYHGIMWDAAAESFLDADGVKGGHGNIGSYVISPFNIFIDPLAKTISEASYAHVTNIRDPFYVLTKYGKELKADDKDEFTDAEGVRIVESWYNPDVTIPNGRHVIWAYADPAHPFVDEENPYPFKTIPIVDYVVDITTTGERISMVEDMWGTQKAFMKIFGYFEDNLMLTQNSQWKTTDSEMEETLSNQPGKVHHVAGMDTLEALQTPELSSGWQNGIAMLQGTFPDISGVRQVNYGSTSSGVTAASAIVALQEAGKTIKELKEDGISAAIGQWAKMAIQLMKLYTNWHWTEIVGATPNPADMDTPFDVSILYSEALPGDKNMRVNMSKVMVDSQIIDPTGFAEIVGDPVLMSVVKSSQQRIQEQQQKMQEQQALQQTQQPPGKTPAASPLGELGMEAM
jgi:hypothetical protein